MLFIAFLFLSLFFLSIPQRVLAEKGEVGSTFLKVPISARATALAGAFSAAWATPATLEYNPAGLAFLPKREINLSHIIYLEETSLQSVAFATPFRSRPKQWNNKSFASSSEDEIFLGFQYRLLRTEDELRNVIGVHQGDFDHRDQLFHVASAFNLRSTLSVGIAGKIINSKIHTDDVSNYAFDAGGLWNITDRFTLGASIINLGPDTKFRDEGDPLPTSLHLGGSSRIAQVLFLSDLAYGLDGLVRPSVGLEYKPIANVALRMGALHQTTFQMTGGLGVNFNPSSLTQGKNTSFSESEIEFGLDYAVQTHNDLGLNHNFTLQIRY